MNAVPAEALEIRRMEMSDIPAALEIERRSFPIPWSSSMFVLELSKAGSVCLVTTTGGVLAGYLVASRYAQIWHVMNVSVAPEWRRRGIARAMIDELFRIADGESTHYTLEVRVSNTGAIGMYERCGFASAGVRPGYYADNREDALIMWRSTDREFVPPNVADPTDWMGHR